MNLDEEAVPTDEELGLTDESETVDVDFIYGRGLSAGRQVYTFNMQYPASMQENPATTCPFRASQYRSEPTAYNAFVQGCMAGAGGG